MDLAEFRVLDLSRLLPGGYATQLLASTGAEVIKIEAPDQGDYLREFPPINDEGVGSAFAAVNRGKRSLTLDLSTDDGREVFLDLVGEADVVFESFRPGVVKRLGVDYESVQEYNEDIVYCSLTGYGQDGPYADRPGHDLNYAGVAGLLDMTRPGPQERPTLPGAPVIDVASGMAAAFAIVTGLLSRSPGGPGNYIDVSMTDVAYSLGQVGAIRALGGMDPRPGETMLTGRYPCYDVYETSDGRHVTLAALEPQFWRSFCNRVGRNDLEDHHRSDDPAVREALRTELQSLFRSRTQAAWRDTFEESDVPFGVVNTPRETLSDPHLTARGMASTGGEGRSVPHVRLPVTARRERATPVDWPALGADSDDVLSKHGYRRAEIERLREAGVIGDLPGSDR